MKRMRPEKKMASMPLFLVLLAFLFLSSPAAAQEQKGLTLWIHPYLPATELVRRFTPLADYLAAELKQPVHIRVQRSFQSHVDFVGQDQADIAFMGPVPYILVRKNYGAKPLLAKLQESDASFFHCVIAVRQDSPLTTLADLKGKSFAFTDPIATMGHIVPRALLAQAGVAVSQLRNHDFLDSYYDVALAVLGGYFDAGAIKDEIFAEYEQRGLRALATSPPVPENLFLARATLPAELVERLRALMYAVNNSPDKEKIVSSIRKTATGLVPVAPQDYDSLEKLMRSVDSE